MAERIFLDRLYQFGISTDTSIPPTGPALKQTLLKFLDEHCVEQMLNVTPPPGVSIAVYVVLVDDDILPLLLSAAPTKPDMRMASHFVLMSTSCTTNALTMMEWPQCAPIGIIRWCRDPWNRTFFACVPSECYRPFPAIQRMLEGTIEASARSM